MRIRRIDIENLASLRGRQPTLDLAGGDLGDAGLVAITGATGAGKTTILDAICLALFDQTPRLKDRGQDPRELLSRGAGEASATVELELDDGRRWIVEWAVHRARNRPDGNLQTSRRRIVDAVTGETVADGKTEVAQQIESGLGFDFEQFTGVILLAQGDFAKFLEAGDADRSQLLERLTGTEIYSRLSQAAFERHRERQDAVRLVTERLQDVRTLDDERRRAVEEELDHLAPRLMRLQRALDDLEAQRLWFERLDALRDQARASAEALAAAQAAWDASEPDQKRLDLGERAALLAAPLESAAAGRRAAQEAAAALDDARKALDEARAARLDGLTRLFGSLRRFDLHRESLEQDFARVEPFAEATDERIEALRDALRAFQDGRRRLVELRARLSELARQIAEARQRVDDHEAGRLRAAKEVESRRNDLANLARRRDDLTGGRSPEQLTQRQIRLEEALKVHGDFAALDLETLRKEETKARAAERRAQKAVDKARAAVGTHRLALEQHEVVLELAIKGAEVSEHRDLLEDDVPCPLCGSTDHPWAEHPPEETSQALEAARHRAEELKATVDQAEAKLDEASSELARDSSEVVRLEERVEAADRAIKSLLGRWMELRFLVADLPEKPTDFEPDGPRVESEELKETLRRLRPIDEEEAQVRTALRESETKHHRHLTQLEVAKERLDGLEQRHAEDEAAASTLTERIHYEVASLRSAASDLVEACRVESPRESPTDDLANLESEPFAKLLRRVMDGRSAYRQARDQRRRVEEIQRGSARRARQLLADVEMSDVEATMEDPVPTDEMSLPALADRLDEHLRDAESAEGRCRIRDDRLRGAETGRELGARRLDVAEGTLRDALNDSPFADESDLRDASLGGETMRVLRGHLDALNQTKIRRAAEDERSQAELAKHREQAPGILDALDADGAAGASGLHSGSESESSIRAGLQSDLDATRQRHRAAGDRHKALEIELAKDDAERKRLQDLSADLEHLEGARDRAARLYDLIGHRKGDKFRRFAQQLNLDQLLGLANRRLDLLEPRYQLTRSGQSLDLEVVDRDMADERRPVTTLSGGESFLVSLALALALADLRRGTLELGTLFLDEGFGSLDEDTLDQALAVLEQLQAHQQTQILVISHVGALQERIAHRIDVRKRGGGLSELRVRRPG